MGSVVLCLMSSREGEELQHPIRGLRHKSFIRSGAVPQHEVSTVRGSRLTMRSPRPGRAPIARRELRVLCLLKLTR